MKYLHLLIAFLALTILIVCNASIPEFGFRVESASQQPCFGNIHESKFSLGNGRGCVGVRVSNAPMPTHSSSYSNPIHFEPDIATDGSFYAMRDAYVDHFMRYTPQDWHNDCVRYYRCELDELSTRHQEQIFRQFNCYQFLGFRVFLTQLPVYHEQMIAISQELHADPCLKRRLSYMQGWKSPPFWNLFRGTGQLCQFFHKQAHKARNLLAQQKQAQQQKRAQKTTCAVFAKKYDELKQYKQELSDGIETCGRIIHEFDVALQQAENYNKQYAQALCQALEQQLARYWRLMARQQALAQAQSNNHVIESKNYHPIYLGNPDRLQLSGAQLLDAGGLHKKDFTLCTGTAVQQCVHTEIVAIVNQAGQLHHKAATDKQVTAITTMVAGCCDSAQQLNNKGDSIAAYGINDFCYAVLDCATGIGSSALLYAQKIAEHCAHVDQLEHEWHQAQAHSSIVMGRGVLKGLHATYDMIRHPQETLEGIVALARCGFTLLYDIAHLQVLALHPNQDLFCQKIQELHQKMATTVETVSSAVGRKLATMTLEDYVEEGISQVVQAFVLTKLIHTAGKVGAVAQQRLPKVLNNFKKRVSPVPVATTPEGITLRVLEDGAGKTSRKIPKGVPRASIKEYWESLMRDPAHGNKITIKSIDEALVGLAAEEQGLLKGPLIRDTTPAAEFIDRVGQAWDVKAAVSKAPNGKYIFNADTLCASIKRDLSLGENILLDLTKLEINDFPILLDRIKSNFSQEEIKRIAVALQKTKFGELIS